MLILARLRLLRSPPRLLPLRLATQPREVRLGRRRGNLDKHGRAVVLAREGIDAPRQWVLVAQAPHLLDLVGGEVVLRLGIATLIAHLRRQVGRALRTAADVLAALAAHAQDGAAARVAARQEDEGGVVGGGFGGGRVVNDGVGGRERRGAVGQEVVVRRALEAALCSCCRLVAAYRGEWHERLASCAEQLCRRAG